MTSLVDVAKSSLVAKSKMQEAYPVAFNQALIEAQVSKKYLTELWAEYSYVIDSRTGRPYNYVPIRLPRIYTITNEKTKKKETTKDSDVLEIDDCEYKFSRDQFYRNRNFQHKLREYYHSLGHSISFVSTNSGWIIKVYMD